MLKTITSDVLDKLAEIGFGEDEISIIQMVHELKSREYTVNIREIINQIAFQNLSEGIAETFEKNNWSDEDFSEIVENYRDEKKSENG